MATIHYVTREEAPHQVQTIYDSLQQHAGSVLNMYRALAHNPAILARFMALSTVADQTELPSTLRELAYLKVSHLNGCDY